MQGLRPAAAGLAAGLLVLAGCGGGSGPTADGTPPPAAATADKGQAPADARITLTRYGQERVPRTPATVSPETALHAALALALPPLQSTMGGAGGATTWVADPAIVLPALQAARVDVLRAATAGETRAQVEAALPAAVGADAVRAALDGVSRSLWAPASALFERDFLASTDVSGAAAGSWRLVDADTLASLAAAFADYGPVDALKLRASTRLVIGQRVVVDAPANGQATAFEGIGLAVGGRGYVTPMVALEGPGGSASGDGYVATATWVGDRLWVSLRPPGNAALSEGVPPATLDAALLAVWSAYSASTALTTRSTQVWPQMTRELADKGRLPTGISLPYDEVHANLSGLDGGGTFLTETANTGVLVIDAAGLRATAAQAMAFTASAANLYAGGSAGTVWTYVTMPIDKPVDSCPHAGIDWRGAYLALIDRAGRLLLVATLPSAVGNGTAYCSPN